MALSYYLSGASDALTWASAGTPATGTICYKDITITGCAVGDLIVVSGCSGGFTTTATRTVATAPGSVAAVAGGWTTILPASAATNDADVTGGRGVVTTAGTLVVRVGVRTINSSAHMGVSAIRVPVGEWDPAGTFAVITGNADADGALSLAVAATSTVYYFGCDWNAAAVAGTATPASSTSRTGYQNGGAYTTYARTWTGQAAGTRNYGMSSSGLRLAGFALAIPEATGSTPQTATPDGVATAAAVGTPTITTSTSVAPTGIASGAAVGTPTVSTSITVTPTGIASAAAVGTPVASTATTVAPDGIPTGAAVGTPTLGTSTALVRITGMLVVENQTSTPDGIPTAAAVGTPALSQSSTAVVRITGMSAAISGNSGPQTVTPTGIPSAAAVGTPTLSTGAAIVRITGMSAAITPTGSAVVRITGMAVAITNTGSSQVVTPTGIPSGAAVGTPALGLPGSAVVRITGMVATITAAVIVYEWQERKAGNWSDVDWIIMERRAGEWVPLDS